MARNRIGLQFAGFEEFAERLERAGGDLKKTTEEALVKSKTLVTANLMNETVSSKYPASGKYSAGDTRRSIDTSKTVGWTGDIATIKVGFSFEKSGITSIFLMYGTPRMPKVQGIYDAVYGSRTKREIKKLQKKIFADAIAERIGG